MYNGIEEVDLFDYGQGYKNIDVITGGYDANFSQISNKFNELIQAVKQLDRKINKE